MAESDALRELQSWYSAGYGPSLQDKEEPRNDPWRILEALSTMHQARNSAQGGTYGRTTAGVGMSPAQQLALAVVNKLPNLLEVGLRGLGDAGPLATDFITGLGGGL